MSVEETVPIQVVAYRDICRHPEDDTLRLKYADLLDEIGDERVECPKCEGKGYHYDPPFGAFRPDTCDRCRGKGAVLAMPDAHDRAEFIRLQISLAPCRAVIEAHAPEPVYTPQLREKQLLDAHPEWRKCPCPAPNHSDSAECSICRNTGDLFTEKNHYGEVPAARTVHFARGFPDSVECAAADVWREGVCLTNSRGSGTITVPTEWAKAAVRGTPVTRFVLTSGVMNDRGELPDFLRSGDVTGGIDALAKQVGDWVRREVYKKGNK